MSCQNVVATSRFTSPQKSRVLLLNIQGGPNYVTPLVGDDKS